MAENESGQEKTEQATPRKLEKSREQGQVARSRELSTTLVVLGGALSLFALGEHIVNNITTRMYASFTIDRDDMFSTNIINEHLMATLDAFVDTLAPFCLIVIVIALFSPALLGGWNMSAKALTIKLDKLDPIKGLKRMFSLNSLIELGKALAKFSIIAMAAGLVIYLQFPGLLELGKQSIAQALSQSMNAVMMSFIFVASGLILISLFDVPYQIWYHLKQLRMTKQEVKDELKDTEGKPEVRRRIKELQQKFAMARMMEQVPHADVIVINPTHYSIAIRYDVTRSAAPLVTAKGIDNVAMKIREIGQAHNVLIISTPPLARALYYSCELDQEVPAGLYVAVAQVLAYVYQLSRFKQGAGEKPSDLASDLPIPDEYQRP